MSWALFRWVWVLEGELHVGMPPAGALNRTRLYIPARAVWGALTAESARRQSASFPDYQTVGARLKKQTRFTYLFPAQKREDTWHAWLPEYRENKGLVWVREDRGEEAEDRRFRRWLLTTRPATAIAPASGTAEEGTLRELEVIVATSRWGKEDQPPQPVGFAGYVFLAEEAENALLEIEEIFVGGDIRYGLGRLKRVECSSKSEVFRERVELQHPDPIVVASRILSHTVTNTISLGALERLGGWDILSGVPVVFPPAWAPGSKSKSGPGRFCIREEGLWYTAR